MFKGLGNIQQMMQQAQQMSKKMQSMREELAGRETTSTAGGGAVTVTVNGKMEITALQISPEVIQSGDASMLSDLVMAAVNQALTQMQKLATEEMSKVTGGMDLGGLGF